MQEGSTGVRESNRDPWLPPARLPSFISLPSLCPLSFSLTVSFQQSSYPTQISHSFPSASLSSSKLCLTCPHLRKALRGPYLATWLHGWSRSFLTTHCTVPPSLSSLVRFRCLFFLFSICYFSQTLSCRRQGWSQLCIYLDMGDKTGCGS